MVETLRLALENIDDDICFSYSDIVYDKKLIKALLKKKIKKNIILPINLNWKNTWNIRKKPILIDAESLILKNNFVIEIGKKIENPRDVHGQFMGILLIPRLLRKKLLQKLKNKIFEKYQTTKLLNNLILDNFKIEALKSKYHWYEFDDYDDLTNYKKEFKI